MNPRSAVWTVALAAAAASIALANLAGCDRASPKVSYAKDVAPIFDKYCRACHAPGAPGYEASGFGVQDYAAVMKGTKFGAVVVPGDPTSSTLNVLVEGRADPALKMPHVEGSKLSEAEVATLRRWVEQGAKND
jgi:mono/diheme cytochrome c family protein